MTSIICEMAELVYVCSNIIISYSNERLQTINMEVIIQSPRLRIREELNHLIQDKVDHLKRLNTRITSCSVLLKKENGHDKKNYCIEIQLQVSRKRLFAEESAESFEAALHKVVDDLASQLRRIKTQAEKI